MLLSLRSFTEPGENDGSADRGTLESRVSWGLPESLLYRLPGRQGGCPRSRAHTFGSPASSYARCQPLILRNHIQLHLCTWIEFYIHPYFALLCRCGGWDPRHHTSQASALPPHNTSAPFHLFLSIYKEIKGLR
jgi:hypothetical protein